MRIPAVTSSHALAHAAGGSPSPAKADFADVLRRTAAGLADLQAAADTAAESVATGDLAHLHEAVIAMQRASLALDFAIAVRNHVVDGINELLRTQV